MPSRVLTKQFRKAQLRARRTILTATLLILSVGSVSTWQLLRLSEHAASVAQSYDAIQTVGELSEALLSAETGHRGFLLTGQEAYLRDYERGVAAIPQLTSLLRQHLVPYVAGTHLAEIEAGLASKVREMADVLAVYEAGHRSEALAAVQTSTGKVVMDNLRELLSLVRKSEESRLDNRFGDFRRTRTLGLVTVTAVGVFALLLTFFLLRSQRAASDRLLEAVNIIQGQKGYLEAMLSSVNAPLMLLDLDGKIRYANTASVELLQDTAERLIGRPLAEYVRIRDPNEAAGEGTIFERALAERRVLRERRVQIHTPRGPQVMGLIVRPVEMGSGAPIGCMITLRDIDQAEATVEELHQQDRVRDLEATLGRIVAETSGARLLLERCADAIRRTSDAEAVRVWVGDAADPNAALVLLRRTTQEADVTWNAPAVVNDAWRRGIPREDVTGEPLCFVFPLSSDPAPLGVIEIHTRTPMHSRLAVELPRLAGVIALGYERRRNAERAARMAMEKDRFIATLSHELRGPLLPLKYAMGEIAGGEEPSTDPRLMGLLTRQVAQLERLVEDLLDVQRLQRGALSLRLAELDVRAVVEQSVEAVLPLIDGKTQKLEVDNIKEPLPVVGDQARLVQVLVNLLGNASRYSPVGATIRLAASKFGRQVELRVSDHGIGIAEENLERVFHMFEQGNTGGNTEGLGIGLALVRQLVVLHGGHVLASSPGIGGGATFTVRLPLASARSWLASGSTSTASPRKLPQVAPQRVMPASAIRAPMFERCVVVDDDVDSAETLALMLESWGLEADVAHDESGALEAIHRLNPELVLLDLTLPGHGRFSLVERLRGEVGPSVRVVAVTGHAGDEIRKEAMERGFDDLLVKPISTEQLARAASRVNA